MKLCQEPVCSESIVALNLFFPVLMLLFLGLGLDQFLMYHLSTVVIVLAPPF